MELKVDCKINKYWVTFWEGFFTVPNGELVDFYFRTLA